MQFIERHPVKTQVATAIVVIMAVVSGTVTVTDDRAKAMAGIVSNEKRICKVEDGQHDLEKIILQIRTEMQLADRGLQEQIHKNDIISTEVRVKLASLEAILIKIDRNLEQKR